MDDVEMMQNVSPIRSVDDHSVTSSHANTTFSDSPDVTCTATPAARRTSTLSDMRGEAAPPVSTFDWSAIAATTTTAMDETATDQPHTTIPGLRSAIKMLLHTDCAQFEYNGQELKPRSDDCRQCCHADSTSSISVPEPSESSSVSTQASTAYSASECEPTDAPSAHTASTVASTDSGSACPRHCAGAGSVRGCTATGALKQSVLSDSLNNYDSGSISVPEPTDTSDMSVPEPAARGAVRELATTAAQQQNSQSDSSCSYDSGSISVPEPSDESLQQPTNVESVLKPTNQTTPFNESNFTAKLKVFYIMPLDDVDAVADPRASESTCDATSVWTAGDSRINSSDVTDPINTRGIPDGRECASLFGRLYQQGSPARHQPRSTSPHGQASRQSRLYKSSGFRLAPEGQYDVTSHITGSKINSKPRRHLRAPSAADVTDKKPVGRRDHSSKRQSAHHAQSKRDDVTAPATHTVSCADSIDANSSLKPVTLRKFGAAGGLKEYRLSELYEHDRIAAHRQLHAADDPDVVNASIVNAAISVSSSSDTNNCDDLCIPVKFNKKNVFHKFKQLRRKLNDVKVLTSTRENVVELGIV